jgi:hypothetical protein
MNAPAIKINKPVREQVSKEEWEARVNLAACYRLMAEYGMIEMVANHISVRVPGSHNEFLINPYGMLYEEMTASSTLKVMCCSTPPNTASIRPASSSTAPCMPRATTSNASSTPTRCRAWPSLR